MLDRILVYISKQNQIQSRKRRGKGEAEGGE
jgi:hypothetical protein